MIRMGRASLRVKMPNLCCQGGKGRGCYCFSYRTHGLNRAYGSDSNAVLVMDDVRPDVLGNVHSNNRAALCRGRVRLSCLRSSRNKGETS